MKRIGTLTALIVAISACGEDGLEAIPEPVIVPDPPVLCDDGTEAVNNICPVDVGSIVGRVCQRATGIWLNDVTATVTTSAGEIVDITDIEGRFQLDDVPVGTYYVSLSGTDYSLDLPAEVVPNTPTIIGDTECRTPPGHLKGRVCDETTGLWVANATITLDDADATSVTSDIYGYYIFLSIAPDDYTMTITTDTGFSATRAATVRSGEVTDVSPMSCEGGEGSITGRICGGNGVWITDARVYIELGGGAVVETTTDAAGQYNLAGVPAGTHTVKVEKGSFTAEFDVTVDGTTPVLIPDPQCVVPSQRIAVVTGVYDSVEDVLTNLGYGIRDSYNQTTTPVTSNPMGDVDIIDGETGDFWLRDFLGDPVWMDNYDIIFLNCGVSDSAISGGDSILTAAINNLRTFTENGGSVYSSDWASEMIRLTFPGRVNWYGGNTTFGAPRQGNSAPSQSARVVDNSLDNALGRSNLTINLDLPQWVVLDQSQPPGLVTLIEGNVSVGGLFGIGGTTLTDTPLVVRFDFGQGRVLFTSAHNESQTTPDLQDVLNYLVFEL